MYMYKHTIFKAYANSGTYNLAVIDNESEALMVYRRVVSDETAPLTLSIYEYDGTFVTSIEDYEVKYVNQEVFKAIIKEG